MPQAEPFRMSDGIMPQWPDWVPGSSLFPKASMCARRTRGSIRRSPRPRRWSPTAMPIMPAAAMARCGRRPRRWRSWHALRRAEGPAGRLWRERPARRGRGQLRPRRPCAGIGADRAGISGRAGGGVGRLQAPARPDLPAVRRRRRATSSSPRRRSACRCSAIPTPAARSTGCSTGSAPSRGAACWSAPMRWARRSG